MQRGSGGGSGGSRRRGLGRGAAGQGGDARQATRLRERRGGEVGEGRRSGSQWKERGQWAVGWWPEEEDSGGGTSGGGQGGSGAAGGEERSNGARVMGKSTEI